MAGLPTRGRRVQPVQGKEGIMETLTRFGKSLFFTVSATALVLGGGIGQVATAGDWYEGTATVCAVDPSDVTTETKRNGFTYTSGLVIYYRIETDNELMNGFESLTSYSKLKTTPNGKVKGLYWGETVMTPDQVSGVGTLEETFSFKAEDADEISGTLHGTGDFEGVAVEYALTFDPAATFCSFYPPCVAAGTCIPVMEGGAPGFDQPAGYLIEGVVFGY